MLVKNTRHPHLTPKSSFIADIVRPPPLAIEAALLVPIPTATLFRQSLPGPALFPPNSLTTPDTLSRSNSTDALAPSHTTSLYDTVHINCILLFIRHLGIASIRYSALSACSLGLKDGEARETADLDVANTRWQVLFNLTHEQKAVLEVLATSCWEPKYFRNTVSL